jgi:hypothetical protein
MFSGYVHIQLLVIQSIHDSQHMFCLLKGIANYCVALSKSIKAKSEMLSTLINCLEQFIKH